ncbi:methyl-accepting chemotaxis protein [Marinomonas fungiae]|uniref:Methyl-accepting chemotaxis protein n=1 Tax=Marinomonas fungiae TaxID=1137284 RepID=A0A0K6IRS7_9GAMM|nr:methyl-accepting chemotaxis protein [Marinomonas fungiae]CUB05784.1 Methyl-accepting chemotaxis protein [Marinomonas fungiae]
MVQIWIATLIMAVVSVVGVIKFDIPIWFAVLVWCVCASNGVIAMVSHRKFFQRNQAGQTSAPQGKATTPYSRIAANVSSTASKMAIGSAEVSYAVDSLTRSIQTVEDHSQQISQATSDLSSTGEQVSNHIVMVNGTMEQTAQAASQSEYKLREGAERIAALAKAVNSAAEQLERLKQSADDIETITDVIKGVSEQTNLLALNAAIEAARAGEQGRGFAVVADEVRTLAGKSAEASQQIADMLNEVRNNTLRTRDDMAQVTEQSQLLEQELGDVTKIFLQITQDVRNASTSMEEIKQSSLGFQSTSLQINSSIDDISVSLATLSQRSKELSHQAGGLSQGAESVFLTLDGIPHDSFFKDTLAEGRQAADQIGKLFESWIDQGKISLDALFDQTYTPISNTNPTKYSTAYDQLTDQFLPDIQEPILERHRHILYAGAVDRKGYFPTHNRRYTKPLTGDYDKDLVNNRTKRIFSDPTGSRCGAHTDSFLMQTYKRDTGDILHDLSIPIYVKGKHWGGFRIGFQASY